MASKPTTRQMSDKHEDDLAELLRWRRTKGSGNQFSDPTDGRHDEGAWRFCGDGKSTLGGSLSVSRETWGKLVDQSHGARPLLPLRFYGSYKLDPVLDLAVCDLHDLAEMIATVRGELG